MARRTVAALPLVMLELGACRTLVGFEDYANDSGAGDAVPIAVGDGAPPGSDGAPDDVRSILDVVVGDGIIASDASLGDAVIAVDAAASFCTAPNLLICLPFDLDLNNYAASGMDSIVNGTITAPVGNLGRPSVAQFPGGATLSFPNSDLYGPSATVEAFVNPDVDGQYTIFDAYKRFSMTIVTGVGGAVQCHGATTGNAAAFGTIPAGKWTHVACRFDEQAGMAAFVSGVPGPPAVANTIIGTANLSFVGATFSGGNSFVGYLDSVRVFTSPRTDAEILSAATQ